MNIKNEETVGLAHHLAELTGESITEAVTEAIRERLQRIVNSHELSGVLLRISKDCAARLDAKAKKVDHGQLLNDERGLPK